jgi:hypothetical protein
MNMPIRWLSMGLHVVALGSYNYSLSIYRLKIHNHFSHAFFFSFSFLGGGVCWSQGSQKPTIQSMADGSEILINCINNWNGKEDEVSSNQPWIVVLGFGLPVHIMYYEKSWHKNIGGIVGRKSPHFSLLIEERPSNMWIGTSWRITSKPFSWRKTEESDGD